MNTKTFFVLAIFTLWATWFFRYDISDSGVVVLDRITGDLYYAVGQMKRNLHDTPDAGP